MREYPELYKAPLAWAIERRLNWCENKKEVVNISLKIWQIISIIEALL
ncbi:MAG: hypothetical protein SVM80_10675 [Halobacteriota archaeon]|nr:hypothetical protein [Halobacteriota archaeon]